MPLAQWVSQLGSRWRGRGTAFATKSRQLDCTLLAFWGAGHEEAWLLLTDLSPEGGDACWYGLRSWIEQYVKECKRGGWQWQRTRLTDAARAERWWLALAVATRWLVRVGGAEEVETTPTLPEGIEGDGNECPRVRRWQLVSVFARGWVVIIVALINHGRLPWGRMIPEPWPTIPEWQRKHAEKQPRKQRVA